MYDGVTRLYHGSLDTVGSASDAHCCNGDDVILGANTYRVRVINATDARVGGGRDCARLFRSGGDGRMTQTVGKLSLNARERVAGRPVVVFLASFAGSVRRRVGKTYARARRRGDDVIAAAAAVRSGFIRRRRWRPCWWEKRGKIGRLWRAHTHRSKPNGHLAPFPLPLQTR